MRVAVIDYGAGNLFSLLSALTFLELDFEVVGQASALSDDFGAIVLPGVGAFQTGMNELEQRGLIDPLKRYADQGRRLIGICLGAQLLLEKGSEFGNAEGLGLIRGSVEAMSLRGFTTPVVGWAPVHWKKQLFGDLQDRWMYFVHSFEMVVEAATSALATTTHNGVGYTAAVHNGSTIGFQFHPEKSGLVGLQLLKAAICEELEE